MDRPTEITCDPIDPGDFHKVEIRVGRVVAVTENAKARNPAYILTIDFGPLGLKASSAQVTENYRREDLLGRQVVAVVNLPVKRVAGVASEVLVLAVVCPVEGTVLLTPDRLVNDGARIF
jgi:tRNA-binding protein